MGVVGKRWTWLSVVEGEGGRWELSMNGEGRASEEEDGLLSSGTPTTAIWGTSRSSEAITFNAARAKQNRTEGGGQALLCKNRNKNG
jgi:hypothetical protein